MVDFKKHLAAHPNESGGEAGEADGGEPIQSAHPEIVEDVDFAAKSSRLHGEIDFVAQLESAAEQRAGTGDGDATLFAGRSRPHGAALARLEHLVCVFQ